MGYNDGAKNRQILQRFNNDMAQTVGYLSHNRSNPSSVERVVPETEQEPSTIDMVDDSDDGSTPDDTRVSIADIIEPLTDGSNNETHLPDDTAFEFARPQLEDCPICCNEYANLPSAWKTLECMHKLCLACHSKMLTSRFTMSFTRQTFLKCPFCSRSTGIEVGTCPDLQMNVSIDGRRSCEGYGPFATIRIDYEGERFHRTAYLPNTGDGQKVLELLKTAFDRRLIFAIGTSNTSGRENAIVWNIHHKTAISGGVSSHGYPDPQYLDRVKDELKGFGI